MTAWSKKRGIMRRYDVTASIYDMRYAEEQEAKFAAAFKHVNAEGLKIVLDAGCGTGLLFRHIASIAEMIVGVDISKETLSIAKENARQSSAVNLVLADADSLPFVDSVFSHVFAFTLVQNMPKPASTIGEITRMSKADGVVVVSALKKAFSKDIFEKLLGSAGLSVEALEQDELKCYVAICRNTVRV